MTKINLNFVSHETPTVENIAPPPPPPPPLKVKWSVTYLTINITL